MMEDDKIKIEYNSDGSATVIVKENDNTYICNLFKKKNIENKKYKVSRKKVFGNVVVTSLLTAIILSCGVYVKNYVKEINKERQEDEDYLKNKVGYNQINNVDIEIVKAYVDEVLADLENSSEDNLAARNLYKNLYSKLITASDYSLGEYDKCIREIALETADSSLSFGVGKYKKYASAKCYNGEIYFSFEDVLSNKNLEDVAKDIVITYLPNDITPYVSVSELEEYKKNQEKDYKDKKGTKKLEEKMINEVNDNIDNADLIVLRAFLDEVLFYFNETAKNGLGYEKTYYKIISELNLAETTDDYAFHIKEAAKITGCFGVGRYEKYLTAKNYNGIVYFPFIEALPTYSLEEVAGEIVITYLPNDTTPYVSANNLEEFEKSKRIENYMKSL